MAPSTIDIPENTILVIIGASGDLAKKKLVGRRVFVAYPFTDRLQVSGTIWPCE